MTIKHLVISGGGPTGIKAVGALKYLSEQSFWNINDIKTIYSTSAGSLISVLLALKFDLPTISDYILNRPWHEAYPINISQFFDFFKNKGLYSNVTEIFFKPFLNTKDLSVNITMKELYEYSNIDLHMFTVELNEFKAIDISHKTYPDLSVITAVHMSLAIPIAIAPVCIDNKCYIDGGILCNYPLQHCLDQEDKPDISEVLGLRKHYLLEESILNKDSNMLDYLMHFTNKLINHADTELTQITIPNEIIYDHKQLTMEYLSSGLYSNELRKELFNNGIFVAEQFLKNKNVSKEKEQDKENDYDYAYALLSKKDDINDSVGLDP